MRLSIAIPAGLSLLFALACTGGGGGEACDLDIDNLAGKTFVMSEAQANAPNKDNPLARLKFVNEDGGLKAKYTAMSLGDIYTYDCKKQELKRGGFEQKCAEKERLQDWCEGMLAWDRSCTERKLKKLGATASSEDIKKAMTVAKKNKREAEANEDPKVFQLWKARRANLGNKLQGELYAKVDEKKCRLRIDDLYWTLYKGEKKEDSNPVGTNPFVKSDENWMFEHCDNQADLWDLEKNEMPTAPLTKRPEHAIGKAIHYFHTAQNGMTPEDGCTYSFDTYAGWLPLKTDQQPTKNADGKLVWHAEHTFGESDIREIQGQKVGVYHMARFKTCGGKKEKIDVACRATVFPKEEPKKGK